MSLPPLLYAPIVSGLLFWLMAAMGRAALLRSGIARRLTHPWERGFVYAATGAGLLQYVPFTLAIFGLLSVTNLRIALTVLVLICARHVVSIARSLVALRPTRPSPMLLAWCGVLLLFIGALFVRAVVIGNFGDDDGYHLLAPKRWLQAGSLDYLPTYAHTNAPMGFEMIYAVALASGGPSVAKLMNFGAGLLFLLGVALCARRLGHWLAGVLAISVLLFENPFVDLPVLLTLAYTDMAMCWLTIAAVLAWLIWREQDDPAILALTGLCAGFAGAFKFTGLWVGIAICLLVYVKMLRERRRLVIQARAVLMTGVLALLPVVPWLWRNAQLTGNPVYPVLSELFPTRAWSAEHAEIFSRYFRYYNWGQDWTTLGDSERRLILMLAGAAILVVYATTIALVKRPVFKELLLFAFVQGAAALLVTGLYFRFLLPGTICTILVLACIAVSRLRSDRWVLALCTLILIAGVGKWSTWGKYGWLDNLRIATGGVDKELSTDPFWRTWGYINGNTPTDARVLLAAFYPSLHRSSGVGFWVDRMTFTTDNHLQDDIPLHDWSSFIGGVRDAAIDFVVIYEQAPERTLPGFSSYAAGRNEYPFARRLVDDFGTRVFQAGNLGVYRISRTLM